MRKSEITPELIELSKKAKEMGFPQDVEEGDWYFNPTWKDMKNRGSSPEKILNTILAPYGDEKLGKHEFLILEFSRCLEWLRGQGYQLEMRHYGAKTYYLIEIILFDKEKQEDVTEDEQEGETHHEAIAKAVCKILSEGQEVKILEEQCK